MKNECHANALTLCSKLYIHITDEDLYNKHAQND